MEKVSVVISTYNRFKYVLNAIESVKKQTYPNIEIIVVNDCSSQKEYYNYDFEGCKIIHLKQNSKYLFGYAGKGYVRNIGIKQAKGQYIAMLDDDDIWFPNKIHKQLEAMKEKKVKMSCTEGLIGFGCYNPKKKYKKMISESSYATVKKKYEAANKIHLLQNGHPEIWDRFFLEVHNSVIFSSSLIEKMVVEKVNFFICPPFGGEDYFLWKKVLKFTKCIYLNEPLVYYDAGHGDGRNW